MSDFKLGGLHPKYEHVEAFALMQYQDEVTGDIEIIWNSRDGVTPFTVHSRAGFRSSHVNFKSDVKMPNHWPRLGERVFVDLTKERAQILAREYVEKFWESGLRETMRDSRNVPDFSKDQAVEFYAGAYLERKGEPDLIAVDWKFLQQLRESRRGRGLTEPELCAIEARAAAATPGPWIWDRSSDDWNHVLALRDCDAREADVLLCTGDGERAWGIITPADADFIAAARADVPSLVAEVRRVVAQRDRLAAAAEALQEHRRSVANHPDPETRLSLTIVVLNELEDAAREARFG
jgi:hypothetical protein